MVELKVSHSATGSIRLHQHYPACGDVMTDLLLQDLRDLTSEGLVQILSNEKKKMLGEQKVPENNGAFNWSCLISYADLVTKARKGGGKRCYKVKS